MGNDPVLEEALDSSLPRPGDPAPLPSTERRRSASDRATTTVAAGRGGAFLLRRPAAPSSAKGGEGGARPPPTPRPGAPRSGRGPSAVTAPRRHPRPRRRRSSISRSRRASAASATPIDFRALRSHLMSFPGISGVLMNEVRRMDGMMSATKAVAGGVAASDAADGLAPGRNGRRNEAAAALGVVSERSKGAEDEEDNPNRPPATVGVMGVPAFVPPGQLVVEGKVRLVTPTWHMPKCNTRHAWLHWMLPDPPLRYLQHSDGSHWKRGGRDLADLELLMTMLEDEVKRLGLWKDRPTEDEAEEMYERCRHVLERHSLLKKMHGKWQRDDLSWWQTVVKDQRSGRKRKQEDVSGAERY